MYYGERFNSVTHAAGTVAAAIGGALLVVVAVRTGDVWKIVSISVHALMLLFYTAGIAFYSNVHKVRHGHGIWHLFVLAGSICHYNAVLLHVA